MNITQEGEEQKKITPSESGLNKPFKPNYKKFHTWEEAKERLNEIADGYIKEWKEKYGKSKK